MAPLSGGADLPTGNRQLQAILWKQWLLKRRGWVTTLVEIFSPVIMMSILVLAYKQVDVEFRPARIRVLHTEHTIRELQADFGDWVDMSVPQHCLDLVPSLSNQQTLNHTTQGLQPTEQQQQELADCFNTVSQHFGNLTRIVLSGAQKFIDRNGPLPILTVDEFILLHKVIQAAVQTNPQAVDLLRNVRSTIGRNILGNLLDLGQVAFAPATPDVLAFADHMVKAHDLFADYFYGVFETAAQAENYAQKADPRLWALVIFDQGPNAAGSDYTIRTNYTCVPSAGQKVNRHNHGVPRGYKRYFTSGFLSLQAAIEGYSLGLTSAKEAAIGPLPNGEAENDLEYMAWASVFPTPAYATNEFYSAVGPMLGLLVGMSLLFPLSMLVRGIVEEKESRTRETMAIMGLKPWVSPLAWAISYGIEFVIIAALTTAICCTSFFKETQPSLLFLVLLLFTMAELAFGMMVASLFGNAKIAAIVAPLLHFSFLMPRYIFFRTEENQALWGKAAVGLLSPSAFTFAADLFADYEKGGDGLGWDSLWEDSFPLGAVLVLLSTDTFLYLLLAWYLAAVMPTQWGTNRPWHFIFSGQYWRDQYRSLAQIFRQPNQGGGSECIHQDEEANLLGPGGRLVHIRGLRKVYGHKVAVQGLSMSMKAGEITALLGHNGAGKSSVIGMMTGLTVPDDGDCHIAGNSIVSQTQHARRSLGYCPQGNVMYGRLTVLEHLQLYAAIKGLPGGHWSAAAREAAEEMIKVVGLADKKDTPARALSGGMKRKLQVAIALLGNSKVILLDEPTSGVDPVSRRALWEILLQRKSDQAILLVTHYTDEADILSDQVAIMSDGDLVAIGSSWQIKQKFSNGYTLNMTTEVGRARQEQQRLIALVREHIPQAAFVRSAAAELAMQLPMDCTAQLADMLDELEAHRSSLGLSYYSISMPSLEEAFLKAGEKLTEEEDPAAFPAGGLSHSLPHLSNGDAFLTGPCEGVEAPQSQGELGIALDVDKVWTSTSGFDYKAVALWEMIKKRAMTAVRDSRTVLWSLVLPICTVCLVMTILKINIDPSTQTMLLDLSVPPQTTPLSAANLPTSLTTCTALGLYTDNDSPCRGSYSFHPRANVTDSWMMNRLLLEDISDRPGAQYAALVFNDPVVERLTAPSNSSGAATPSLDPQSLIALVTAATAASGSKIGMDQGVAGRLAGQGAALAFSLSKEARAFRKVQARFGDAKSQAVNLMHNASAQHALPSLLSGMHQTVGAINAKSDEVPPRFVAHSNPLPLSLRETVALDSVLLVLTAVFVLVPFCLLSGAFCMNPVVERMSGSLHMQLLSGCPAAIYWAGSYIWDMGTHLAVCLVSLLIFAAFDDKATVGSLTRTAGTFLVLKAYGLSIIPLSYCYSMAFSSPSAAQVAAAAANFVLGFCAVNGSYVMTLIPKTQSLQRVLVHFFRLNPSFLLGEALIELTRLYFENSIAEAASSAEVSAQPSSSENLGVSLAAFVRNVTSSLNITSDAISTTVQTGDLQADAAVANPFQGRSVFDWSVLGRPLFFMIIEAKAFSMLVLLLDQYKRTHSLPWPLHRLPWLCQIGWSALRKVLQTVGFSGEAHSTQHLTAEGEERPLTLEMTQHAERPGPRYSAVDAHGDLEAGALQSPAAIEDENVAAERRRVDSIPLGTDTITIQHLRKVYGGWSQKVALRDLCLSVRHGERLGLLGANGAGKSTTLGLLTRQVLPTAGDAIVHGVSVLRDSASGQNTAAQLGYCPQADPLLDLLTAREHLSLFARLKGVKKQDVDRAVEQVLRRVKLPDEMSHRPAGQYSGGNKRKLALGIALIGGISAILLDEPSSGMDPGARRAMWKFVILATEGSDGDVTSRISTILTTHSMEECEALCSRIAILHQGNLLCLGTPAQLKALYSSGFSLEVHTEGREQQEAISSFVESDLGGRLDEAHVGTARFTLQKSGLTLAHAFRVMEIAKTRFGLSEYGLSQPTLEQVFMNVVGKHNRTL